MLIFDGVLMAGIAVAIIGWLFWALSTQHRDHGVVERGSIFRRQLWARPRRAHVIARRPLHTGQIARRPWPAV